MHPLHLAMTIHLRHDADVARANRHAALLNGIDDALGETPTRHARWVARRPFRRHRRPTTATTAVCA